ncbi:LD-carboxypeptidase [Streptomyces sp. PGLac3x]
MPYSLSPLTRPARLAPGARVAGVAPAGPVPAAALESGLDLLRGWGLDAVVAPHVLDRHPAFPYLAGEDADRAADLQNAWCDPSVDAVFCARGGYGCQRMTGLLDWEAMRAARPKPFVGYSDITALHEQFAVRLGVATLHAPMTATAGFLKNEAAREHLRATLFEPESVRVLTSATGRVRVPGRARGVTLGGCVSLLAAELGGAHPRPAAAGGLLLIEDIGEEAYRLDRILTQLLRARWLDGVSGVALGSGEECGPDEEVRAVLHDRRAPLGVPVAEEFGFGHGEGALTMPFGVAGELDAEAGTLTLEVPALG